MLLYIHDWNRRWVLIGALALLIIAGGIGGYWIWKKATGPQESDQLTKPGVRVPLRRMANLPPKEPVPEPPAPDYTPDAPVLEQARKALSEGVPPSEAVALANSLPDRPERADAAFLLLEYAADEGHAEAALAVGQYYDPAFDGPSGTIRKNPATAYEWYQEALRGGQESAKNHLAELRKWVEKQAEKGSKEAKELLADWR